MRKFFALATLLAVIACSPNGGQEAAKTKLISANAPKVEATRFTEQPAAGPVAFLWDFGKGSVTHYQLNQTLQSSAGPDAATAISRLTTITGRISLVPMSPKAGLLTFADMTVENEGVDEKGQPQKMAGPMNPPAPNTIAPDSSGADLITRLLLPLPGTTLKPGEATVIPVTLPLRAGGVSLPVPALMTLTYAADAVEAGRRLARLDLSLTAGDFKPPADVVGEFTVAVGGVGRCYFDPAAGRIVLSATALRFVLDAKTPKRAAPDKKEPPVKEYDTLHVDSDSFFKVAEAAAAAK